MAGTDDGSGSKGDPNDQRRRPKPPVLDLKATEVGTAASADATAQAQAEAQKTAPTDEPAMDRATEVAPTLDPPAADPPVPIPPSDIPMGGEATQAAEDRINTAPRTEAAAATKAPGRRSGWGIAGLAIGGGAGAAAGAAALLAVAWLFGLPLGRDHRVAETAQRTAALQARIEEIAARPSPAPAADARIDDLVKQVSAMQQALEQIKALEPRLAQAEAALASQRPAADQNLAGRVTAIDESTKSLAASLADLRKRLDEIGAVAQAAQEAAARSSGAASAASADVAGEVAKLGQRLTALEQTTKTLQTMAAQASTPDRDRAARRATAALALRAALESGTPFAAELAAAKALSPDPGRLAPLEPFAAEGAPTAAALARELDALAETARRTAPSTGASAGFLDWVQAHLSRLVRVRTADGPTPAQAGDAIGRVQAFARGDIDAAVAEAEKLPPAARAPLDAWIRRAKGRIAAFAAARDFARESLAALAAPGEPASR